MNGSYQLRHLTDHDISLWAQFCASCFAYKANPPPASYFERHFYNDPRRDSSLIRVIDYLHEDDTTTEIVASTRVFQKTISIGNGKTLEAGGIGEVCTSLEHRKRGLAKRLLLDAIDDMEKKRKMHCSLLHASSALTAVYERSAQYVCVNTRWSLMTVKIGELNENSSGDSLSLQVRLASFPNDTAELHRIHKSYSENRFAGCIVRSESYWNEYLQHEIGQSLYVLTSIVEGKECILGWMSIRPRGGRFQLCEFGVDLERSLRVGQTTAKIMSKLLQMALSIEDTDGLNLIEVQVPTAIVEEMKSQSDFCSGKCPWIDWSVALKDDDDIGWMYKMFDKNFECEVNSMIHIVNEIGVPHLIWPADSF